MLDSSGIVVKGCSVGEGRDWFMDSFQRKLGSVIMRVAIQSWRTPSRSSSCQVKSVSLKSPHFHRVGDVGKGGKRGQTHTPPSVFSLNCDAATNVDLITCDGSVS